MSIFSSTDKNNAQKQQGQIADSTKGFMSRLQSDANTAFAGQQNILNGLSKSLTQTLNSGPSQFGYSAPELAAMNTLATTQTANDYQNARAAAGAAAAASGGGAALPSGAAAATQASIAQKEAEAKSNALLGIQESGYKQGSDNYQNAVKGLEETASLENPSGVAQQANSAGTEAFNQQTTLYNQAQANSPWGQVGGLVGSLAGAALNMAVPGAGSALGMFKNMAGSEGKAAASSLGTSSASGLDNLLISPKPMQSFPV